MCMCVSMPWLVTMIGQRIINTSARKIETAKEELPPVQYNTVLTSLIEVVPSDQNHKIGARVL